ncbi:MAG: 30S ribosomal protein S8 [Candidatus Pacebacteria bacterium]|nr:30S ribosomal protein S8 [Candidatus Paceibacterota bacterium]MCF7862504.1 30S ribosomal protein S8 [Candidatus Paceibacterota bacterium]
MDQIANMIIMLKNASLAGKESVIVPFSKLKNSILACLQKEGYVGEFSKKMKGNFPVLEVEILYSEDGKPKITYAERVSKQSCRSYMGVKDINKIRGGTGILVLSTPKGILAGKEARKEQVGGEALFKLW